MISTLRYVLIGVAGGVLATGCDTGVETGPEPEGVRFSYTGATTGSFASAGTVSATPGGLPALESFAMAQRDSIGGLLLGSFRSREGARGDLFILQIRGTQPGSYVCGDVTGGPNCYGHLYLNVDASSTTSVSAEAIYGISEGEVVLQTVGQNRVEGTFGLTLRDLHDPAATLTIANGTIDVPVVQGVFNSSFACLAVRLREGPEAPCE